MKSMIALALIAGFGLASAAYAAPVKLSKDQMDKITAGGQSHFPPGQFPAGNPAKAPGQSNTTPPS
jgi:hypothetical protein